MGVPEVVTGAFAGEVGAGAWAAAGWTAGGTGAARAGVAGARTVAGAGAGSTPSPAAYSPHSAWLSEAASPCLGWLVNSGRTSSWTEASTSSTNPYSAFFGPTSTNTRAPASYSVCR